MKNQAIEGLWIGSRLGELQIISLRSFLEKGYSYVLWAYNDLENVPAGVEVRDARDIISYEVYARWFLEQPEKKHTKQTFANYFRYMLKYMHGGWWMDMDCVCVKPFNFESEYVLTGIEAVSRRELRDYPYNIINGVFKVPYKSLFLKDILDEISEDAQKGKYPDFGVWGTVIFTKSVFRHGLQKFKTKHNVFCPHPFSLAQQLYTDASLDIPDWAYTVHFYNYVNAGSECAIKGSLYDRMRQRYFCL
jgi:glycosyl transferase-like sugar-binding protein